MEAIREYLIGVTAAALLCAITAKLQTKGMAASVIRLLCGVVMALAVVAPWMDIRLDTLTDFATDIQANAESIAAEGKNDASQAIRDIISQQTRTYIMDKAESLGLSVTVDVTLSQDDTPVAQSVTITGSVSPYSKKLLSTYIADTFGIAAEAQTWIQS